MVQNNIARLFCALKMHLYFLCKLCTHVLVREVEAKRRKQQKYVRSDQFCLLARIIDNVTISSLMKNFKSYFAMGAFSVLFYLALTLFQADFDIFIRKLCMMIHPNNYRLQCF
jgi:hypothetical protein